MKNNQLLYNLKGIARMLEPEFLLPRNREQILKDISKRTDIDYIKSRVDYYCQLENLTPLDSSAWQLRDLRFTRKKSVYYFDSYEYARYFPQDFKAHFEFGDINYICPKPSIVKSRPTKAYSQSLQTNKDSKLPPFSNSTLLNLEKNRHFIFINDPYNFESKQDILFYRGGIYQEHRVKFFERYFSHPMCDLGHTGNKSINHAWQKQKIGIAKHLPYKFLLSLEGNDVASNLKWVMSSNSLTIMPKPKFETWFMEGQLKENYHYAQLNDDYSNLEELLEHFIAHPNDAKDIIHNAHEYVRQFFDKKREDIISLLVLEKYFYYTGQINKLRDL